MWTVKTNFIAKWENRNIGNENQRKKWKNHWKCRKNIKIVTFGKQFVFQNWKCGTKICEFGNKNEISE